MGNLLDRIRHSDGVVDFIDVGLGMSRWPTFNVADMAVSVGAVLLAWVLWDEDRLAIEVPAAQPAVVAGGVGTGASAGMVAAGELGDRA
jgi:signal peptidase II